MKKIIYIVALIVLGCDSETANDCLQTTGNSIQKEITVSSFENILVNRNIELIIKDAPNYKVIVETGANLINDVNVTVINNQLILTDNNTCNYVRDFNSTKIYVEAPNIREIKSSSQYEISSTGVLNYNTLRLISEDFTEDSPFTVGDFRLTVNAQDLNIVSNNLSFFYVDGLVNSLFVGFYSGAGRFEGANLIAQNVTVYHRGSNDMVVNPIQSLTGELRGTGNLISVNQPTTIAVNQFYTGQLIFN